MLKWCMLVGLDWAEPMMFYCCMSQAHAFFHAYVPFFFYLIDIDLCWYFSVCPSLSLSLSFFRLVALWHLSVSLLRLQTLFIPRHLLLILPPLTFGSVMRRPIWTSRRTFHDAAFIWNAKSSYRIFSILTFPLSSTVGFGNHFVASRSLVPPWSYRSFISTCMDLIIESSNSVKYTMNV